MKALRFIAVALLLATLSAQGSELFCKRYDFTQEKYIRLDTTVGTVTVRDVKFEFPSYLGPKKMDLKGRNLAQVSIKNYGEKSIRVHLAIALFDEKGNLVGCGTTGSKVGSTKAGEEETFFVTFDYVKSKILETKVFYLTVETEPLYP